MKRILGETAQRLGLGLLVLGMLGLPGAVAAGPAIDVIKETVDGVLGILRDASHDAAERRTLIREQIVSHFNFEAMAKSCMAQHWGKLQAAQKKEFIELFMELLERSYMAKVESATNKKVTFTKEQASGSDYVKVFSQVSGGGDAAFDLEYSLAQVEGTWRVYDIVIEGVSLVANYRTQINNMIVSKDVDFLLKSLRLKVEQEKAGDKK